MCPQVIASSDGAEIDLPKVFDGEIVEIGVAAAGGPRHGKPISPWASTPMSRTGGLHRVRRQARSGQGADSS